MTTNIIEAPNGAVAVIHSDTPVITDTQSALDLAATLFYEHDCQSIVINKEAIIEDFFKLSTGVAGEITQKLVNFRFRLAIIGDFSGYTSKPLHDYIYECNKGHHLYFAGSEEAAVAKLGGLD
ncbi:MAG: DUF4180 domain-containing protein [Oscillospiraceae bacterium]|jgi:hypothetical protein|nr:DUF4180 domain-containing protein [Oscillospiraceae bacterium]